MNKIKTLLILALILGPVSAVYAGPLHEAARNGNLNEVKRLLDTKEASIDDQDHRGITALIRAAEYGQIEVVKELLARKANMEIDAGAILEGIGIYTALRAAILSGHPEIAIELVKHGANFNIRLPGGRTYLMGAAANGLTELVMALLKRGADINDRDENGLTALQHAHSGDKKDTISAIREWSIRKLIPVTDAIDIKILDGKFNINAVQDIPSLYREILKKRQREIIETTTGIKGGATGPANIIHEYLESEEE